MAGANPHQTRLQDVLQLNNSAGSYAINFNGNQALDMAVENLANDPSPGLKGRLWYNTTNNLLMLDNGSQTVTVGGATANSLQSVLNSGNSAGSKNIDMNENQLLNARLENRTSDPSPGNAGRIWFRTDVAAVRVDAGASIATLGGAQGLSSVLGISNSAGSTNINFNGNQAQNLIVEKLSSDPGGVEGRLYYNTTAHVPKFYNGSSWNSVGNTNTLAQTLALGNSAGSSDIDFNSHQARNMVLHNNSGSPGTGTAGFVWYDTGTGLLNYETSTVNRTVVGADTAQTLTNKTISGSSNTLTNIPDSALSANVSTLNGNQSITGTKTFSTPPVITALKSGSGATMSVPFGVSSDTFTLNSAGQTLTGKTLASPVFTGTSNFSNGQATNFRVENLTSDPTPGNSGRVYYKTTTGELMYDTGSSNIALARSGGIQWGAITGNINNQTDLQMVISGLAPISSPVFSGGATVDGGLTVRRTAATGQNTTITNDSTGNHVTHNSVNGSGKNGFFEADANSASLSVGTIGAVPLNLFTNNTTRMSFDSTGKGWVGSASSSESGAQLLVRSGNPGAYTVGSGFKELVLEGSGTVGTTMVTTDANYSGIKWNSPSGTGFGFASIQSSYNNGDLLIGTNKTGGFIALQTGAGAEAVRVNGSGNVGIGTTAPAHKLDVAGDGNFSSAVTATAFHGNADTATTATNSTNMATVSTSSNATFYPIFAASSTNGNQPHNLGTGLTFNPSTNNLATTTFTGALAGNATTATTATNFSGSLSGDVTGTQGATAISAATVTGKLLTGFSSGAGTVAATDTILQGINKIDGNVALKAPIASPTFTGTVTAPTVAMDASGVINPFLSVKNGGVSRWNFKTANTETGSNVGSDFIISRRSDAGADLGSVFGITRSTGLVTFGNSVVVNGTRNDTSAILSVQNGAPGAYTAGTGYKELVLEGSGTTGMTIAAPDASTMGIKFNSPSAGANGFGGLLTGGYTSGDVTLYTNKSGGSLRFQTDTGTEQMRIDNVGRVGIGTTTPNLGGWPAASKVLTMGTTSTNAGGILEFVNSTATADVSIGVLDFIQSSNSTKKEVAQILVANTGATSGNTGGYIAFLTKPDGVTTNPVEAMRIGSTGNVGIGTTAPAQKLEVNGTTVLNQVNEEALLIARTAPTISSGFCTGGAGTVVTNNNGTAAFKVTVGSSSCGSTGVITLPAAANGWNCWGNDVSSNDLIRMNSSTTTSATIGHFSPSTGAATNFQASDVFVMSCFAF